VLSGKASGRSRWAFVLAMRGFQITDLRFEFCHLRFANLRSRRKAFAPNFHASRVKQALINIPENVSPISAHAGADESIHLRGGLA
jgi:hypothetical protein